MLIQFLQPLWLWAAAGVLVPVVIHLWNIREGKTIKVGSIAFLTESAKSQANSLLLSQWLLLLLRCLIILLLAVLLAKPYRNVSPNANKKGWIVVASSGLKNAYQTHRLLMDSLLANGYSLHHFDPSFTEAKLADTAGNNAAQQPSVNYWTLLQQLDDTMPASLPIYLFTDNLLLHFAGSRPSVSRPVHWYTYPQPDTSVQWLANAYPTTGDSIRVVTGISSDTGTFYRYQTIGYAKGNPDYQVRIQSGSATIISNDTSQQPMNIDTSALVMAIYTKKYPTDARYLKAALDAIKDVTGYKLTTSVVNKEDAIPANTDWLFWLADEPLPAALLKNHVLRYEPGKAMPAFTTLVTNGDALLTTTNEMSLYQMVAHSKNLYQPVWTNAFGDAVLSVEKGDVIIYHFYSRFHPQWSDLVWNHSFPKLLFNLVLGNKSPVGSVHTKDRRRIDTAQILPAMVAEQKFRNSQSMMQTQDISQVCWLILFFLFLTERIIAFWLLTKGAA